MAQLLIKNNAIMALDVGASRIGVAIASLQSRLPHPLTTLQNDADVLEKIVQLMASEDAGSLVVGLPRNLDGDETAQTATVRDFTRQLQAKIAVPISFQDEALTSVKAREELDARGKPYAKSDIDALAATYILEDYLQTTEHAR